MRTWKLLLCGTVAALTLAVGARGDTVLTLNGSGIKLGTVDTLSFSLTVDTTTMMSEGVVNLASGLDVSGLVLDAAASDPTLLNWFDPAGDHLQIGGSDYYNLLSGFPGFLLFPTEGTYPGRLVNFTYGGIGGLFIGEGLDVVTVSSTSDVPEPGVGIMMLAGMLVLRRVSRGMWQAS